MKCKDFYHLFQEKGEVIPTAVKSLTRQYPDIECKWIKLFKNIPHLSTNDKLRRLSFKMLHRTLVTKKELKRFKISDNEECLFCNSADSLEHTFLECPAGQRLFQETWFNNEHKVNFTLSKLQFLFKDYDPPRIQTQTSPENFRSSL